MQQPARCSCSASSFPPPRAGVLPPLAGPARRFDGSTRRRRGWASGLRACGCLVWSRRGREPGGCSPWWLWQPKCMPHGSGSLQELGYVKTIGTRRGASRDDQANGRGCKTGNEGDKRARNGIVSVSEWRVFTPGGNASSSITYQCTSYTLHSVELCPKTLEIKMDA